MLASAGGSVELLEKCGSQQRQHTGGVGPLQHLVDIHNC